ncbi:metal-dependent hydrolase [Haladaptatus salinisoli]|uniref:metal-dependent hydrolase n=1 Tax=Haladaptatus salinisoli TaxID=2884876 RepID=UPI001D0A7F82|nr:metal-dependent hydrolase [Haladaptatus salinisoli]
MMVGHALLAFALAALVAARFWPAERALAFGAVAGAFATVPDVDMVYALVGLAQAGFGGVWQMTAAFWASSHLVHRAVTHSLVVGAIAAPAFVWATGDRRRKALAAVVLAALVWLSLAESGVLGAGVMLVFVVAGAAVARVAAARTDLGPRALVLAAAFGLLSHPFGDLFTGEPPQFLYPFDAVLLDSRLALLGEPTLNLLAIFALELATAWLAVVTYFRLRDQRLREHVHGRAALGAGYALAALVLPAPTLSVSYHFVFSVLAVSVVGVGPQLHPRRPFRPVRDPRAWACTGLAAVTLAILGYAGAYLVA